MTRPLRNKYPCAVYHITCRDNVRQQRIAQNHDIIKMYHLPMLLLAIIVAMLTIVPTTEAIQYDWNAGDEGFVSFQDPWSQSGSSWGGVIGGGSCSARMVGITGLGDADSKSEFNTFIDSVSSPESDLMVTVDVFKESGSAWKAPTRKLLPPFNEAFDNAHSSLVMVWLSDGAFQYSFGSELNDADGWEPNVQLDYLGSRVLPRHPFTHELLIKSELEVRLQTYREDSNGFANYQLDKLSITSAAIVPEPISSLLFLTGGILLTVRLYIRKMKV